MGIRIAPREPAQVRQGMAGGPRSGGVGTLRIHDLRHSHAAVAVNGGEGLRVVAGLLGHADIATTFGFAHLVRCWTPPTGSRAALPTCLTAGRRTMTERARLTDALAHAAQPRGREYSIHDTALQGGFILRVQPNGARFWVFRYRRLPRGRLLGADGEARRGPALARRQMDPPPSRGGAADSADRMQARRDTPLALARGRAGQARPDWRKNWAKVRKRDTRVRVLRQRRRGRRPAPRRVADAGV